MSSFVYNVGLQNVGSYQVSGRPWLKHYSTAADGYQLIEFPNVTKSIYIHHDRQGNGKTLDVMFCSPTSAVNMPNANEFLQTQFNQIDELTFSIWIKMDQITSDQRILSFTGSGVGSRIQTRNIALPNSTIRFFIGTDLEEEPFTFNTTDWVNLVVVLKDGESKLFINGELLIEHASNAGFVDTLSLGSDPNANFDGFYSSSCLFSKALTNREVYELWTSDSRINPSNHSQSQNLVSRWLFDDGAINTLATPDTTTLIYDRVSNNNLTLNTGALTFVNGWTIDNAEARHSWTLSGHQQIGGSVKTKRIFIKYESNDEISIYASLTNIPASRMYELTGPGIDE